MLQLLFLGQHSRDPVTGFSNNPQSTEFENAMARKYIVIEEEEEKETGCLDQLKALAVIAVGAFVWALVQVKCNSETRTTSCERKTVLIDSVEIALRLCPPDHAIGEGVWMGETEVTQAQWEAVMGNNPSHFISTENPVENVSWDDCQEFLKKLNAVPAVKELGLIFRLPTDGEWEYACRAGSSGEFCKLSDGTEIMESTLGRVAWFEDNSDGKIHSVRQKDPNAFGLYDMQGNVWEWCQDKYGSELDFAKDTESEYDHVIRGGSWNHSAKNCVSSYRIWNSSSYRSSNLGFRLCASDKAD